MAKRNLEVELLKKQVEFLQERFEKLFATPSEMPFGACDNSCVVTKPTGMATNGGCRCDERKLRQAVRWWRQRAEFLQATILLFKDGNFVEQWNQWEPKYKALFEREFETAQKER